MVNRTPGKENSVCPVATIALDSVVLRYAPAVVVTRNNQNAAGAVAADTHLFNQVRVAKEVDACGPHSLNRSISDSDVEPRRAQSRADSCASATSRARVESTGAISRSENRETVQIDCDVIRRDHDHICVLVFGGKIAR